MRQKSKAKGKRILGVVLALVFLISCIMTPDVHAQAESMIIALSARGRTAKDEFFKRAKAKEN